MNRSVAIAVLLPLLSMGVACGDDSAGTSPVVPNGEVFTTEAGVPSSVTADTSAITSTTAATTPPTDATTTPTTAPAVIDTPEAVKAALDAGSSGEAWYPRLTGMSSTIGLGAPVWFLDIDVTGIEADYTARHDVAYAIVDAINAVTDLGTVNFVARWSDGTISPAGGMTSSGGQLADVVSLPPAPTTPDEVRAWLATVFGPGGLVTLGPDETWYASITSFGTQDYGSGPELALTTSLTAGDVWQLTLLQSALQASGMLIESASITCADGHFLSMAGGSFGGTSAPGMTGYMYPAR